MGQATVGQSEQCLLQKSWPSAVINKSLLYVAPTINHSFWIDKNHIMFLVALKSP